MTQKYLFNAFLCLFLCAQSVAVLAQKNEGVIQFDEVLIIKRGAIGIPNMPNIPEVTTRKTKMQLAFKAKESYYKESDDVDPEEVANGSGEGGGGGFNLGGMMRAFGQGGDLYRDLGAKHRIEQREWQGKNYLVEDTLKSRAWKITTEKRTIAGYDCVKATTTDTIRMRTSMVIGDVRSNDSTRTRRDTARAVPVVAWFTTNIPVSAGPGDYGGLPGMILCIEFNGDQRIITAKKVDLKTVKPKDIAPPAKGEKMTNENYMAMVRAWMKQNGGGMMRMQRN